ncbi:unnamed protein product, partial [Didymodactylos carnosus]
TGTYSILEINPDGTYAEEGSDADGIRNSRKAIDRPYSGPRGVWSCSSPTQLTATTYYFGYEPVISKLPAGSKLSKTFVTVRESQIQFTDSPKCSLFNGTQTISFYSLNANLRPSQIQTQVKQYPSVIEPFSGYQLANRIAT